MVEPVRQAMGPYAMFASSFSHTVDRISLTSAAMPAVASTALMAVTRADLSPFGSPIRSSLRVLDRFSTTPGAVTSLAE